MIKIIKSTNPKKKFSAIFIYDNKGKEAKKTIHFGSAGSKDYTIYYKDDGKEKANERKKLYYTRHSKENWQIPMSAGTLAKYILWFKPTVEEGIKAYIKKFKLNLI